MLAMTNTPFQIYLASSSPRRKELLQQIGITFQVIPIDITEIPKPTETPIEYVIRIAKEKAHAGWHAATRIANLPVLAADTEVVLDGKILSKPIDRLHGVRMLERLSGRRHQVLSAVVCQHEDKIMVRTAISTVEFRQLSASDITAYWESGEPKGKAGGYAIQGLGAIFVSAIEGSYSGVVGLPLFETTELLREFGVAVL